MNTKNLFSYLKVAAVWVPFIIFFLILLTMLSSEFKNPTDEYFVATVLRACLLLIGATFFAQLLCISMLLLMSAFRLSGLFYLMGAVIKSIILLPIVDIGIYSVALFIASPEFTLWGQVLVVLLLFPTFHYWLMFLKGPIRNLHQFAVFHQVPRPRITKVLSPFYISTYIDYYFIVLKKTLLPLVFILTVMDFKIMLPRLVSAGMSVSSFVMFFSLIISLHLLTARKGASRE